MSPLRYDLKEGIATITMDDGKANALSHDMLAALDSALDRALGEAKAVVLAGRSGRFCAGFDLRTMMASIEAAKALVSKGAELYLRLYQLPLPVVAACTGHALAGGALLLLVADQRVGARGELKIGLNEVAISLPLPVLAQELARDRLANKHLTEATIQARIYDPEGALEVGYLDALASPEEVVDAAFSTARRLAELPAHAYAKTKAKLRDATVRHIRDTLAADLESMTS
jgi:enoyl-CoA hydratase